MLRRHLFLATFLFACSSSPTTEPPVTEPLPPIGHTEPISDGEASKLLARLTPFSQPTEETPGFVLREGTLQKPPPIETTEQLFPPPPTTPTPRIEYNPTSIPAAPVAPKPTGPLQLLSYQPEGEVDYAEDVVIAFSQAMTELGSDIELTPEQLPLTLTPQPKGVWRWQDNQTLRFTPESKGGLPMATKYKVVIPAKTKSASGGELSTAKSFEFTTPPPYLEATTPYNGDQSIELSPEIVLSFDQLVEPEKILAALSISPKVTLRFSTPTERNDQTFDPKKPSSAIYLRPENPLPRATRVTLSLPPGVYSAEGPLATKETFRTSFTTHKPLSFASHYCYYSNYEKQLCQTSSPWNISFNNRLDTKDFDKSFVTVSPEVPDLLCRASSGITCEGSFAENTTYRVTLSSKLMDSFGQNLNAEKTITIKTGSNEDPYLSEYRSLNIAKDFVTLDPSAKPTVEVRSTNISGLKVSLYSVSASDYLEHTNRRYNYEHLRTPSTPPGKLVHSMTIPIKEKRQETKSLIDLAPALPNGLGHVLLVVAPTDKPSKKYYGEGYQLVESVWVQSTRIGFDLYSDLEEMTVFVQDLVTGAPIPEAKINIPGWHKDILTNTDGVATLALSDSSYASKIIIEANNDVAFSPSLNTTRRKKPSESYRWFVFDDRGLYRPGEEIHVKGWLRTATDGKNGDLTGIPPYRMIYYKFTDSQGNEVKKGEAILNKNGGFDFIVETSTTMNLGACSIQISTGLFRQITHTYSVRVEEFRRPEYEVSVSASKNTLFSNEEAELSVLAKYYAGGGLANAPVTWDITTSEANFTPPNRSDFTFGQRYSRFFGKEDDWRLPDFKDLIVNPTPGESVTQGTEGITAPDGSHLLKLIAKEPKRPRAYNISAQATVRDLNNQSWTADTSLLVHSTDRYVGLRTEKPYHKTDTPIILEAILTDLDGNAVAGQSISLSIARVSFDYDSGQPKILRDDESSATLTSSTQTIEHIFTPKRSGQYQITAAINDSAGRPSETTIEIYVSGYEDDDRAIDAGKLIITPNKPSYKPGETATIAISSQLFPAEGLLLINNGGILQYQRFSVTSERTEVKLRLDEKASPSASIDALVVGAKHRRNKSASQDANLPPQPAFATGSASISVPRLSRTLTVTATPRTPEANPGQQTEIEVLVKDHKGKPVSDAEVTLVVVDESVLALTGYNIPDPVSFFYPSKGRQQEEFHFRSFIELANEEDLKPGERSAKELAEEAANAGVIGDIKGGGAGGSPFASVFGRDDAARADADNILGDLIGDRPGEAEGGIGLGLRGTGIGGGGTGEGTIGLGNENTIGKGGGGGNGSGIGRGGAGFGGRAAGGPEVTEGKAEINGALDKDIIRRVIRRAMPGIKFCYEQALAQNPNLGGKVKIYFVISSTGAVSSSSAVSGINSEVDACVAKKIEQLSFPAPAGGGIVEITYPFLFQSSGDNSADISGSEEAAGAPVKARINLQPLALFSSNNFTNSKGRVKIKFTLPDNLTRYRITAVVAETHRFGVGESTLTASKKLMIRPSFPRFLSFSDQAIIPVLVQNNTGKPLLSKIAMRTQGCDLDGPAGYLAHIPAQERLELRFTIRASAIGACKAQLVSTAGALSDAQEVSIPVYTPATAEAQAIYGVIDAGAVAQPLKMPEEAFSEYGGVTVTASSTAVASLTDSMLYLYRYPYECAEQISSKVLGVVAMRDVLRAFKSDELPSDKKIESFVHYELKRLRERQNKDGGFGFWKSDEPSWPYLSVHVAHVVARAKQKGYTVPDKLLSGITRYLPSIETLSRREYSQETRDSLLAYSLFVRRLLDDPQPSLAKNLIKKRGVDKLPLESLGWLLMVIYDDPDSEEEIQKIKTHLQNKILSTAAEAHFTTDYGIEYGYLVLSSEYRTDAVLLEALIKADPENPLIPKLVKGLRKSQRRGHWGNTQSNIFVMLAMDSYFNTYEKDEPNFRVNLWFGERYAGEQRFEGYSTDQQRLLIPMTYVAEQEKTNLLLSKEGAGRLYYRIGMSYAPKDFMLRALDAGFTVKRTYEGLDSKGDVTLDERGIWHVKAGARVKVTLTMQTKGHRYHVALVDPLPAGFEAQNEGLSTTRDNKEQPDNLGELGYGGWWRSTWYEHDNKRDERVEAFTSVLGAGTYTYSYTALATTPGTFLAAPTKAEEMYAPETFGRSNTETVIVEATPNKM